jgi:hypothetical protein
VNLSGLLGTELLGLGFILVFLSLMAMFTIMGKSQRIQNLREIPAFTKLKRGIGLAVEAGQRLHLSLGHGGVYGQQGASALIGLSVLQRIARAASISDRPPLASSGEATLTILSQDTMKNAYHAINADNQYEPTMAQLTGLTPFSYAAGTLPIIFDTQTSVNLMIGSFGSEIALITDASERTGGMAIAGSENISAQAIMYASAQELLVGEELFAAGAYLQAGPMHTASLRAQDFLRWIIIGIILLGAFLKLIGVL